MKRFEVYENVIAFVLTIVAGVFIGVSPAVTMGLAITYLLSNYLAHDIKGHIVERKLPTVLEGIGDVLAFAAIVLNLVSIKTTNLTYGYVAIGCLLVDFILVVFDKKKQGKDITEAVKETVAEVKEEVKN